LTAYRKPRQICRMASSFTVFDVTVWPKPLPVHLRSHRARQRCEIRGRQATPSVRRERAGGFNVRGGWAGVRVSVDRASVVDGGCRGRDSRRRRPSKRERLTACSVRPKIGRLPRGPARPVAPASAAARRPSASLRTDYRKMEQDHDGNGVLPRKPHATAFGDVAAHKTSATAFGDVAAHKRNETADSGGFRHNQGKDCQPTDTGSFRRVSR
jgi:hypothetical protein